MNTAEFDKVFKLPFNEASTFFRDKLNLPTAAWDDISGAAHAKGFTSAGAYKAELLADLRKMTDKAIAGGMDIREFRKQFRPLVERYGWQLKGGSPAWRSDLIWRTNISTAYQAGRWKQFEAGGITHLMYLHRDGVRNPRPNHVALDGKILPIDDPFWSANYPPNGFGCHCRAVAATADEYQAAPAELKTKPEGWENFPDKGWDYNVGQAGEEQGYRSLTDKFESLPNDIARAWMDRFVAEPAFGRFISGEIKGEFPVAVLRPEDLAAIGGESQTVWLSDTALAAGRDLTVEDYRLLPGIIDNGEIASDGEAHVIEFKLGGTAYQAKVKRERSGRAYLLSLTKSVA